jgi:hypothetical protein
MAVLRSRRIIAASVIPSAEEVKDIAKEQKVMRWIVEERQAARIRLCSPSSADITEGG